MAEKNAERNNKLVIISGFSGSGKSSVLKELSKIAEYKFSVSATTRQPRNEEVHGVDYYFLSKDEFLKKIYNCEMLEYMEYSENYYGTFRKPVMEMLESGYNTVLDIDFRGALTVKEEFADAIMIFITPPTYVSLEKRLRSRGTECEEGIRRRLEISKKEINYISEYDYFVINEDDKQKEAALAINAIVNGEKGINQYKVAKEKLESFMKVYFAKHTAEENIIKI